MHLFFLKKKFVSAVVGGLGCAKLVGGAGLCVSGEQLRLVRERLCGFFRLVL
jgi:hypothetical protein